jgi:hypothetical protein
MSSITTHATHTSRQPPLCTQPGEYQKEGVDTFGESSLEAVNIPRLSSTGRHVMWSWATEMSEGY